jgi:hypothetical protein
MPPKELRLPRSEAREADLGSRIQAIDAGLLAGAQARGHTIARSTNPPDHRRLVIHGERIGWWLYERSARHKVPLTKKELKSPFMRLEAQRGWKLELRPSGSLVMTIDADFHSTKRVDEHPKRPFEGQVEKLLDKFEAMAAEAAERRKRNEDWQRRAFERQTRSDERSQREDIERGKVRTLDELADDWAEAQRLRRFVDSVAALDAATPDASGRLGPWLTWARTYVDGLDPLTGGTSSFLERLFPPELSEYEMNFGEPEDEEV